MAQFNSKDKRSGDNFLLYVDILSIFDKIEFLSVFSMCMSASFLMHAML